MPGCLAGLNALLLHVAISAQCAQEKIRLLKKVMSPTRPLPLAAIAGLWLRIAAAVAAGPQRFFIGDMGDDISDWDPRSPGAAALAAAMALVNPPSS